jgi:hypothetical protein
MAGTLERFGGLEWKLFADVFFQSRRHVVVPCHTSLYAQL